MNQKYRIILNHIKKSFKEQIIFDDFSYAFEQTGSYLLYGPSGCGKTTLMNIIAGIESIDEGQYYFDGMDATAFSDEFKLPYLTQDPYFVNYLTVRENLHISCREEQEYLMWADKLKVSHTLDKKITTLSGGELQRIAMIRGLCLKQKILLLDEPTANLDDENKKLIFQILKQLRNEVLIICISHDEISKQYFDHIIDFTNLHTQKQAEIELQNSLNHKLEIHNSFEVNRLYPYVKKQKQMEENVSKVMVICMFIIAFMMISFVIHPKDKIISSLFSMYDLNYLNVEIPYKQRDILNQIQEEYDIDAVVYDYRFGANYRDISDKNQVVTQSTPYDESLVYETLPIEQVNKLKDHVLYGKYFSKANEVMLGYQKALQYSSQPERLIGKEIVIHTPMNEERFVVSGIFEPLKEDILLYLAYDCNEEYVNEVVFFNNEYTKAYETDHKLSQNEHSYQNKSYYTLYFHTRESLLKFYEKYKGNVVKKDVISVPYIEDSYDSMISTLESLSVILLPLSMIFLIISLNFYIFSKMFSLQKTKRNFCVYSYYGYSWNKVYTGYVLYYMKETFGIITISFILSNLFVVGCNMLNRNVLSMPLLLFSMDTQLMLIISILLFISMNVVQALMLRSFKKEKWLTSLKIGRDLL